MVVFNWSVIGYVALNRDKKNQNCHILSQMEEMENKQDTIFFLSKFARPQLSSMILVF